MLPQSLPRVAPGRRLVSLGKVTAPKPLNLPSQKQENNGLDPTITIVSKPGATNVWNHDVRYRVQVLDDPGNHKCDQTKFHLGVDVGYTFLSAMLSMFGIAERMSTYHPDILSGHDFP